MTLCKLKAFTQSRRSLITISQIFILRLFARSDPRGSYFAKMHALGGHRSERTFVLWILPHPRPVCLPAHVVLRPILTFSESNYFILLLRAHSPVVYVPIYPVKTPLINHTFRDKI